MFITDVEGRVNLTVEDRGISVSRNASFDGDVEAEPSQVSGNNIEAVEFTYSTTNDPEVDEVSFEAFENDEAGTRVGEDSAGATDSPYELELDSNVNTNRDDLFVRVTLEPTSGPDHVCTGTITSTTDSIVLDCD